MDSADTPPPVVARLQPRLEELRRAMAVLVSEIDRWDRSDLPADVTPVPVMVAYGILSQLAADLATIAGAHDTIAHEVMQLSDALTAAVRRLHRNQEARKG